MTSGTAGGLAESEDQLRLMVRIARMYHERGMRQAEIAAELHVSQPRVSRLLKRAGEVGIVRTTVALPAGVHADLEEDLERAFGLREAVVVDAWGRDEELTTPLGVERDYYIGTPEEADPWVSLLIPGFPIHPRGNRFFARALLNPPATPRDRSSVNACSARGCGSRWSR